MSQTKAQLIDPVDGTIVNADINASAAIAGSKISPDFGSQNVTTTGQLFSSYATLTAVNPTLTFTDSNNNPDYTINVNSGVLKITDSTNSADRLVIDSSGRLGIGTSSPTSTTLLHVSAPQTGSAGGTGVTLSGWNGSAESRVQIMSYGIGNGTLAIRNTTANTEVLRVDDSGNVGIGTASPSQKLHVQSSGDTIIRVTSADGNAAFLDLGDASDPDGGRIHYDSGSNLVFNTVSSERMRINSSGNVGIGTTAPSTSLHISASGSSTQMRIENTNADFLIQAGDAGDDGLHFYDLDNSAYRMMISNNGNVGIGTTAPKDALDLGSSTGGRKLTFANYSNLFSEHSSGALWLSSNFYGNAGATGYKTSTTGNFGAAAVRVHATGGSSNSGIIQFFTDDNASKTAGDAFTPTERMRIDEEGKVGIGTTPDAGTKLHLHQTSASAGNNLKLENNYSNSGTTNLLIASRQGDAVQAVLQYKDADTSMNFGTSTGHDLTIMTNGAERLRIKSGGNLFHGRTSAITSNSVNTSNNIEQIDSFTWTLGLHADQAHKIGMTILYSSTNNNHDFLRCQVSGSGGRFVVEGDGDCFNQNGTFSSLSDVSLKENIVDAKSQWNDIKNLKVRNYNFKESTGRPTHTQIGLVAQELETVCPNLVKESEEGLKTVANSVLYMKAIKALQEAMAKIETLEVEVAALKAA